MGDMGMGGCMRQLVASILLGTYSIEVDWRWGEMDWNGAKSVRSTQQSRKGRGNIPIAGTNCRRGERIY
eukprot:1187046-Prorocentrum_minimum.AAC.5